VARLDGDIRGAEPADGVLEANQLREVVEGADLQLDLPFVEAVVSGLGGALGRLRLQGRRHLLQSLHFLTYLDRLTQGFHPDPGRLAARLGLQFLEPRGNCVKGGDAAVMALIRLAQALTEDADLPLSLEHHPREGGGLPL
jgi:hypothetical protein